MYVTKLNGQASCTTYSMIKLKHYHEEVQEEEEAKRIPTSLSQVCNVQEHDNSNTQALHKIQKTLAVVWSGWQWPWIYLATIKFSHTYSLSP